MKKIIYTVKRGYTEIADFENLEQASKFFATLVAGPIKQLEEVSKNGKKAYFWTSSSEFTLSSEEIDIYSTKKDAEFAIFEPEANT